MAKKTYRSTGSRSSLITLTILGLACCAFVWVFAGTSTPSDKRKDSQSINASPPSLNVVSSELQGNSLRLVLRNNTDKVINGFQIVVLGTRVQVELLNADEPALQSLQPGETYEDSFRVSSNGQTEGVSVLAIVYEDGTSEGEPQYIKEIKETRIGQKKHLTRFLPLLAKSITDPSENESRLLEKLESDLQILQDSQDQDLPGNVRLGLHDERLRMEHNIQSIRRRQQKQGGADSKTALRNLKGKVEKKLVKL
ncbi:hypothetical protein BH18ACI2_BH18ACI2_22350 [soil metagenome]